MAHNLLHKSLNLLLKRQTNILSAAFIIMLTVVLSQLLGVVRERLLASIFGVSNILGIKNYSELLPDTLFQLTIAAALSSAFIPVFSEYLTKHEEKDAHTMASTLLMLGLGIFGVLSVILAVFAPFFLKLFNIGGQFSVEQMSLMANLMRIFTIGQFLFIIGMFFSALLQSYNHFFIPGIAAALYNLGIIIGVVTLSPLIGIYSAPVGVILGSLIFIVAQLPLAKQVGFRFRPSRAFIKSHGIMKITKLMWPRTLSIIIFQLGTIAIASFISYMLDPGRMNVIYNFAKTLAFAPVSLFGASIAQAAFPILSREKDDPEEFKSTFMTSFNQILYLILPIAVLMLVLRIPIVRFAFGADKVDWIATVRIGRTLAFFTLSIVAQSLTMLTLRGFYALHDTKIPLIVGTLTTLIMITITALFTFVYHFGVESIAGAYSIGSFIQLAIFLFLLDKKTGGFHRLKHMITFFKLLTASFFTAFALYIPIKLLDKLVFDTTHTINLIILTGISSTIGLIIYLLLTWLFDVKEAKAYILMFKKIGNWREVLGLREEVIDANRVNP